MVSLFQHIPNKKKKAAKVLRLERSPNIPYTRSSNRIFQVYVHEPNHLATMSTIKDVSIIVKWNGKEYPILDLSDQETVAVLKHEIAKLTNVRPERQKLLNLKYKGIFCSRKSNRCDIHCKFNIPISHISIRT